MGAAEWREYARITQIKNQRILARKEDSKYTLTGPMDRGLGPVWLKNHWKQYKLSQFWRLESLNRMANRWMAVLSLCPHMQEVVRRLSGPLPKGHQYHSQGPHSYDLITFTPTPKYHYTSG